MLVALMAQAARAADVTPEEASVPTDLLVALLVVLGVAMLLFILVQLQISRLSKRIRKIEAPASKPPADSAQG